MGKKGPENLSNWDAGRVTHEEVLHGSRVSVLGVAVDAVTRKDAVELIANWASQYSARYVLTPNLDHCVILQANDEFRLAYKDASLVTADGWPLVFASFLTKRPLSERVSGSDLVEPLCEACAKKGLSVFLLGTTLDTLSRAARILSERYPSLVVKGIYSPPFGFETDAALLKEVSEVVKAATPSVLFVALGAPKQELWMYRHLNGLPVGVALGIGASLDFIAGSQTRAPKIVRRLYMEWFWRILTNPKRMGPRYLKDALWFPVLLWNQIRERDIRV